MTDTERIRRMWGARLTAARQARGWSQTDVTAATGIAPATLSRYENGHRLPGPGAQIALADALGVDHADLFSVETSA